MVATGDKNAGRERGHRRMRQIAEQEFQKAKKWMRLQADVDSSSSAEKTWISLREAEEQAKIRKRTSFNATSSGTTEFNKPATTILSQLAQLDGDNSDFDAMGIPQ